MAQFQNRKRYKLFCDRTVKMWRPYALLSALLESVFKIAENCPFSLNLSSYAFHKSGLNVDLTPPLHFGKCFAKMA